MAKKMGNLETSLAIWIKNCYPSPMLEEESMEGVHIRWHAQPCSGSNLFATKHVRSFRHSDHCYGDSTNSLRSPARERITQWCNNAFPTQLCWCLVPRMALAALSLFALAARARR